MRLGVIVGRFQVQELHEGHKELVDFVIKENDEVLIILGEGHLKSTSRNPLTIGQRCELFEEYPKLCLDTVTDCRDNKKWSSSLDAKIGEYARDVVTLYGSRDSFIPYYSGKYITVEVPELTKISATEKRAEVPSVGDKSYREGVIFGAKNRWVNAVPCVDVAIVDHGAVLLGRKKGSVKFQFIGGFVDAGEKWEDAAHREVAEETGVRLRSLTYINSYVIDDYRYSGEEAKITTTFFSGEYMSGTAKAMDDIEEVKWFKLSEDIPIVSSHSVMLNNLKGMHRW